MVLSRAIANNIYTICGTPSLERRYPASRNGGFTAQEYSIRFMEVNDYLPSGVRVLSSENKAKKEPDLVTARLIPIWNLHHLNRIK